MLVSDPEGGKFSYQILSFGSNGSGQLGVGHENDLILPQISFESNIKPKKISCGGNHSMILLEDGSLYWCGDNSAGQCSGGLSSSSNWQLLPGKYQDVACGWEYTLVIDMECIVKVVGHGKKSELGVPNMVSSREWVPVMQCSDKNPKCYSSFQNSLVQDGNRIYGWGPNRKNQLLDVALNRVETPRLIYESTQIRGVAMGKDFTAILDGNILVLRGSIDKTALSDIGLETRRIRQISCMWSSLHILTEANEIFGLGKALHGQILSESPPPDILGISVGSEHGILTTSDCQVYCWGWGEHGNCGRVTESKDPINDKSNIISHLNKIGNFPGITDTFGGCASSWLVLRRGLY